MKIKLLLFISALILCVGMSSCATYVKTNNSGKVPPGQVKKVTGSQSAAPYAPGHNK